MATDLTALKAAIKLVADATVDTVKAGSDATSIGKIAEYQNLIPDLMSLVPQIGNIPTEASALQPADYQALIAELAADLNLPAGKVQSIVAASLKLLQDVVTVMVPDVQALLLAVKA